MICANCRTVNLEGMLFCAKCGRGLIERSGDDASNQPRLIWQIADGTPQTFLVTKPVTSIGRVGGNDIILTAGGVSRQHARLERSGTRCILIDLGSLNGTYVNNERIEQTRDLANGDVIRIGQTSLQIAIPENVSSVNAPPPAAERRLLDGDTMNEISPAPVVQRSPLEEGPATVFDLPPLAAGRGPGAGGGPAPTSPPLPDGPSARPPAAEPATDAATVYGSEPVAAAPSSSEAATVYGSEPVAAAPSSSEAATVYGSEPVAAAPSGNEAVAAGTANSEAATVYGSEPVVAGSDDATVYGNEPVAAGTVNSDDKTVMQDEVSAAELDEVDISQAGVARPRAPEALFWLVTADGTRVPVEDVVTIGRGDSNTIVLSQDRQASRNHARVSVTGETLLAEDLQSANGSFLNGTKLPAHEPREMKVGDQLRVGSTILTVERVEARDRDSVAESDDKTLFDQEDESEKTISGLELEAELAQLGTPPTPAAMVQQGAVIAAGDTPRLTITWGPEIGRSFAIDREVLVIGRTGSQTQFDLALEDRAVSSPHAKIVKQGDAYQLHDLESTNGTALNYERLTAPRVLQDGDLIKVGKTVLLFRAAASSLPPPQPFQLSHAAGGSQVLTFFSLKGGVGTTALAVNTAILLRELTKDSVVLVDLSVERASVTAQLTVDIRRTLDDLGNLPTVETDTVKGIIAHHTSGVDVLPAPQSPQTAELVTAELVAQLIPVLKTMYRWIIIDTMASFTDLNLSSFDQSDLVVVISAPDMATLKTTHACLDVFSALQTTGERRLLLLNTIHAKPRLESADIEKALGERIDLTIPYGEEVLQSVDNGVPLALGQREHPFVKAIEGFVRKIAEIQEPVAVTKAQRGGFWLKLKGMMGGKS